jgi:D-alanine-D-alanine ligase
VKRKTRVGIVFGGRSGEHEVSLTSASSLLQAIDESRFEAVPIGITRQGEWLIADSAEEFLRAGFVTELPDTSEALPDLTHHGIVRVDHGSSFDFHESAVDVVFPLLHGPYGEDGTVQGLLELADIPYVGAGHLCAAMCMDKAAMKVQLLGAGLEGVPYRLVRTRDWRDDPDGVVAGLESGLSYPMFVKPCNMGSSVGITKAHDRQELELGLIVAGERDRRIIVEQGIAAREVECSVLGNNDPLVSVPGEVRTAHEFYDYESKYTEGLADLIIPAAISGKQTREVQEMARRAFLAVDGAGLARVDFFLLPDGRFLVNEVNTMPGFTATSMYPKLWEASGVPYAELIDRLIALAFDRHEENRGKSVAR